MTWTKTADDYPDRLLDLSDAAYRLHHAATTYSNRVGTNGRIQKGRLTMISVPPRTRRAAVVRELETAGLWAADGDGWTLIDFFDAQLSADEVLLLKRYNADRESHRLSIGKENEAFWKTKRDASLALLQAAREQRKAQSGSADGMPNGMTPTHLVPLRSVPRRERERGKAPSAGGLEAAASEPSCEACDRPLHDRPWRRYVWRGEEEPVRKLPFHDACADNVDGNIGTLIAADEYDRFHGRVPA